MADEIRQLLCPSLLREATLQVKTILVAMATKILELATKLEPKSPAWQLKLRRRIEIMNLIRQLKFFIDDQT